MRPKKYAYVCAILVVVGSVFASSAMAEATRTPEPWRTGPSATETTVLTGTQAATIVLVGSSVTEVVIAETPLKIESSELECVECTIFNEGGAAKSTGRLLLKKMKVVTPSACKVNGEQVLTKEVTIDASYMEGGVAYLQARPVGATFDTIKLEKGTGSCPISGSYTTTGSLFFKVGNPTGTYATSQSASSSGAINEAAGGGLLLAGAPATITATGKFEAGGKFFDVE